jgi:hypothetical protein
MKQRSTGTSDSDLKIFQIFTQRKAVFRISTLCGSMEDYCKIAGYQKNTRRSFPPLEVLRSLTHLFGSLPSRGEN